MRVAVFGLGTRGDVQPLLALAAGLRRAGHDAFLGGPSDFEGIAGDYRVPFRPVRSVTGNLLTDPKVREVFESGSNLRFVRLLRERGRAIMRQTNLELWEMTQDAEAIVFQAGTAGAAHSMAQQRGIPAVECTYNPLEPSAELPPLSAPPGLCRGRISKRVASTGARLFFWRMFAPYTNDFRRRVLGLPAHPFSGPFREYARMGQPTLYAYSPLVLPKPGDWRPDAHVVGYFFLNSPAAWRPPEDLCRFVEQEPKPLYIGFGTFGNAPPLKEATAVMEALHLTGQRAVLQGSWRNIAAGLQNSGGVFLADYTPHDWLFPRMATVIHHGGSGTTGATLRAGVPSIVVPHNFDQPYWAQRVHELGVSAPPIPFKSLSADRLAAAIRSVAADAGMQRRAADIGIRIRAEDGLQRAIEVFNGYVSRFRPRPAGSQDHRKQP